MNKLTAIIYLVKNSEYYDEWSGAGMWEAVEKIINHKGEDVTQKMVDDLLLKAKNF